MCNKCGWARPLLSFLLPRGQYPTSGLSDNQWARQQKMVFASVFHIFTILLLDQHQTLKFLAHISKRGTDTYVKIIKNASDWSNSYGILPLHVYVYVYTYICLFVFTHRHPHVDTARINMNEQTVWSSHGPIIHLNYDISLSLKPTQQFASLKDFIS